MMTIQTIQYAVLYHNDDLFQANLLQLKSRLNNYFDNEDPTVQTLLLEIDQLLELRVGYETFAGLTSLPALSTYIQQRDNPQSKDSGEPGIDESSVVEQQTGDTEETNQP